LKEERPIQNLLGKNRQQRIEQHHQNPESRCALHKGEEQLRRKEAHRKAKQREEHRVAQKKAREFWTEAVQGKQPGGVEGRVLAQEQECSQRRN
jgi:hypothetical protein